MKTGRYAIWIGLIGIGMSLLAGCATPDSSSPEAKTVSSAPVQIAQNTAGKDNTSSIKVTEIAGSHPDRYLIKNATHTLETRDVRATADMLISDSKAVKG